jgi:2-dehydropantoate 2-reductase
MANEEVEMRIAIFGAGSVGGYFGGRLVQAGEDVFFIARNEHLKAMQANGLWIDSIKGDFRIKPVQATDDPNQIGEVEMVLIGVKAWQLAEIAPILQPLIGEETGVIFLGNGVDAPSQLIPVLGGEHVLGGLCRISAFLIGPGHIRHAGVEPYIAMGELDGQRSTRVERLRQAFERAGVNAIVPDDIWAAMWEKFIFIASISGVGAITRAPTGTLRKIPETRQMLEGAIEEMVKLARVRGIQLPSDVATRTMAFIDGMAPAVIASMQRDIMEGRPSELEAQNGAVVRMGKETGVDTPIHAFIYSSLLPQEMKARGKYPF